MNLHDGMRGAQVCPDGVGPGEEIAVTTSDGVEVAVVWQPSPAQPSQTQPNPINQASPT